MSAAIISLSEHIKTARWPRYDAVESAESSSDLHALELEPYDGQFAPWCPVQATAIARAAAMLREAFASPYEFNTLPLTRASRLLSLAGVVCTVQAGTLPSDHFKWSVMTPEQRAMIWLCSSGTERALIWGTAGVGGEVFFTRYGMIADVWEADSDQEGPDNAA